MELLVITTIVHCTIFTNVYDVHPNVTLAYSLFIVYRFHKNLMIYE